MTPFLSIVTRHMVNRPRMFQVCLASLTAQTVQDFEQIVLVDHVGRGVGWANQQLAQYQQAVNGDYVLMLDDDDALTVPTALEQLRAASAESHADVIIFRGLHGSNGLLPDGNYWGRAPTLGHISGQDLIVRRAVWQKHIGAMPATYAADYNFIAAVWAGGYRVHWLDAVLVQQQRVSHGLPE